MRRRGVVIFNKVKQVSRCAFFREVTRIFPSQDPHRSTGHPAVTTQASVQVEYTNKLIPSTLFSIFGRI